MKEGKEGREENLLGKRIVEKKVNQERMRQHGEREKTLVFPSRRDQVGKPETESGARMCVCMRVCVYVYTHMCVKNILIFALWYRFYALAVSKFWLYY